MFQINGAKLSSQFPKKVVPNFRSIFLHQHPKTKKSMNLLQEHFNYWMDL